MSYQNKIQKAAQTVTELAPRKFNICDRSAERLIKSVIEIFRLSCLQGGIEARTITRITTKFRDAGRRSAPWRPTSSIVPGRPQDGSDGNRINRWLLPPDHKFYATQVVATLVEVKYFLQTLSFENAPETGVSGALNLFYPWLIEHEVRPGAYADPIQLTPLDFNEFSANLREVQSGHIKPLDRGGVHHPENTFLMIARSNQLQGNLTVAELLHLLEAILNRHAHRKEHGDVLEDRIQQQS